MRRGLTALAFVLVATSVAQAYAPPPAFILSLTAAKRSRQKLDALRVTLKRQDYENGVAKGEPYEVTFTYRTGGRVRREWTDKDGRHVRLNDATRALKLEGDKKEAGKPDPHLMDAVWTTGADEAERNGAEARGLEVLKAWTVAETPVTFARFDGRIAWVIGAEPRQLEVPQVWVDKDDFFPLRMIYPQPGADGKPRLVDERLRNWGSQAGGEFYPGRREVYWNNQLIRVDELVKVDVTPKIDEREWKLD